MDQMQENPVLQKFVSKISLIVILQRHCQN